ncbi:excinuclease ABC subunit UvrC [Patescibacteria group bacterium]|nr:excinuclease ABC subunit UvrC [Patescibacteria group bacterium]MBU1868593.1 excinuclease ABC subunit UvrC [Patescibacteria group bacterium]
MEPPQKLPSSPGIYIFRDKNKKTLYVGKAKNLKSRISSYFLNSSILGPKTRKMVNTAESLKWLVTDTEFEALLLETDLIKRLKPYYNSQWKDDKNFKFIAIDWTSDFPRIYTTRRKINSKTLYFGPYPEGKTVNSVLRLLRRIFPFRDCSNTKFSRSKKLGRGCLYYDLGLCPAPCAGKIDSAQYKLLTGNIPLLLKGKKKRLLNQYRRKMKNASELRNYEKASKYRDKIQKLEYITQQFSTPDNFLKSPNLPVDLYEEEIKQLTGILQIKHNPKKAFRLEAYDISNLQGKQATGSMIVLVDGKPSKSEYRRFKIQSCQQPDDPGMLKEVLRRRISGIGIIPKIGMIPISTFHIRPDIILIDGGIPQLNAVISVLEETDLKIPTLALAKKEETLFYKLNNTIKKLNLPTNNPALHLVQRARDEAHRFALAYHRKLRKTAYLPSR